MIGYLEGKMIQRNSDGILLLAGGIGFEVVLNAATLSQVEKKRNDQGQIALHIYYHVSERTPRPILIGFARPIEKDFFQLFISVSAIGPIKAIKALDRPVEDVALAIHEKNTQFLATLPGIGKRTAEKIIATLHGKVEEFLPAVSTSQQGTLPLVSSDMGMITAQVTEVLTEQLGYSSSAARQMITGALQRNPGITTPEALLDALYREKP